MRNSVVVLLCVATLSLTACGPGSTVIRAPVERFTSTSSIAVASARSREMALDGRHPCDLLTHTQAADLQYGAPPTPRHHPAFDVPTCVYSDSGMSLAITAVTTAGIENGAQRPNATQTLPAEPIAGFPTVIIKPPTPGQRCSVGVDVATEQHLLVEVALGPDHASTLIEPCTSARKAAETAMANLT